MGISGQDANEKIDVGARGGATTEHESHAWMRSVAMVIRVLALVSGSQRAQASPEDGSTTTATL
jgi:hypothetical protein